MQFNVTQPVSLEQIADTLCSALEGGSNSWCEVQQEIEPNAWKFESEPKGYRYLQDYPLNPGGALLVRDTEDDEHGVMRLDAEALQRGLTILAEKYPKHFADILREDGDAITGDVFLQCCLFGKVIYG